MESAGFTTLKSYLENLRHKSNNPLIEQNLYEISVRNKALKSFIQDNENQILVISNSDAIWKKIDLKKYLSHFLSAFVVHNDFTIDVIDSFIKKITGMLKHQRCYQIGSNIFVLETQNLKDGTIRHVENDSDNSIMITFPLSNDNLIVFENSYLFLVPNYVEMNQVHSL